MDPVSDNSMVELGIVVELPPNMNPSNTNVYQFPVIAARRPIAYLKRLWTHYFPPGTLVEEGATMSGSVLANPVVDLNFIEELPAETKNQKSSATNVYRFLVGAAKRPIESLCHMWTHYFPSGMLEEEGVMMPGPDFNFVITCLLSFAAIKSQGETRFPFRTHPQTITVAVTSLIMYGLGSAAEHIISTARPGFISVYGFIARVGRKLCLCILVASLASLFYL